MINRRTLAATGLAFLGIAGCGPSETGEPPGEITFAAPATGRPTRRQSDWRLLLADMAAATGLKVRPFFTPNDAVQLEALKQRRIDTGWFSNVAAITAVRSGAGEVFARTIGGANGYRSVLVVGAATPVTLERLLKCDKTLRYGQSQRSSTPDALAPVAFLFGPNNIEPAKCFKAVTTADAEANLAAVVNGTLDVAALDTALLQRLADAGRPEPAKVTAIWASPPLPEDPILWRKDLDPELKEKLRQFFITDARGDTGLAKQQRNDLTPLGVGGFEAADDSHLLQAREIEARVRWAEAQWSGDTARIETSRKALDAILAERQAVQLTPSGP
jgi:phosphonate transport system substrate-binding protein